MKYTTTLRVFKIVFQNGEFTSDQSTFFGVTLDTVFTVLTTIGIFILGYYINKRIEFNKERKRLEELEEYFRKTIDLLEKPILLQTNTFLKFSKTLKQNKEQHFFVDDVTSLKVEYLKEVDSKDLYLIFIRNKKGDTALKTQLFGKLKGSIEYIHTVKMNLKKDIRSLMRTMQSYTNTYKTNLKIVNDLLNNMVVSNVQRNITPQQDPFIGELDQISGAWINTKKDDRDYKDMYISFEYFIEPIRKASRENLKDSRSSLLLGPIMECVYAYHNIQELKYVNRKHFLLQARGIQNSFLIMKKSLQEFDKMKN